jgi:uncharacterized protein with GYD domain
MARFMLTGKYTADGMAATLAEGLTARTKVLKKATESLGGKLVGMYWTSAADDSVVIVDFPDASGATALVTRVKAAGAAQISIVRLFDGPEFDAVMASAAGMKYRPPVAPPR